MSAVLQPGPPARRTTLDTRTWLRPALAIALVVAAYRTSLSTLVEFMSLDTPLAHLALVPIISIVLALASRRRDAGPQIHDRQLDWIVGLPLVAGALVVNFILP